MGSDSTVKTAVLDADVTIHIRYYPLRKACVKNVEHTGIGEDPRTQDYKVV